MGNFVTRNSSKNVCKKVDLELDVYITERYYIGRTLGEGASSRVMEVTEISTGKRFAMKIMDRVDRLNNGYFRKERNILKMLQHPNITAFKESHVDSKNFYIVSELCEGGDLYERMMDPDWSITEHRARQLIRTMLRTIEYLHKNQIVHRDLKPENFVFKTKDPDSDILLIDFGCARIVQDNVRYHDAFGTPHFLAPEVVAGRRFIRTGNTLKFSDVWSIGVIAYLLMVGEVPFSGKSMNSIFESIMKKPLMFPEGGTHLSKSFLNFCERALNKSPNERLRVSEALNHDWVKNRNAFDKELPEKVIRTTSKSLTNDGALEIVHSLVSASFVYRMGAGVYMLGSGPCLEDVCDSIII